MKALRSRGSHSLHRSRAFTLIEVVVATFIVSLALVALANTVQALTKSQSSLNTKYFANLVANNKMAELYALSSWPELGESDETEELAQREWLIEMEVTETAVESLRRVDLSIRLNDENKGVESVMSGFLSSSPHLEVARIDWTQGALPNTDSTTRPDGDNTDKDGQPGSDTDTNDPNNPTPIPLNPGRN